MAERQCSICSLAILPTDSTADRGGELVHLRCLEPRKPATRIEPPLKNHRDVRGDPICPACGRGIDRGTSAVARTADYMVHLECLLEARRMLQA